MGVSYQVQLAKLAESFGTEIERITSLLSFHSVYRKIYRRKDTGQYIYVEYEDSECDQDDYFKWKYITDEEASAEIHKLKEFLEKCKPTE